jgi:hypothetical protein
VISIYQLDDSRLHSLVRRQLQHLQTLFLRAGVRAVEEGAVTEERHGAEAREKLVGEADDEEEVVDIEHAEITPIITTSIQSVSEKVHTM